jgi:hypothetical protein
MAFNFNWSPLAADAAFYHRAKDLLTTALNKSPKPPIIVDDILVSDFNLGSVAPDLSILEIGDLAEDRFRGIFKMCYSGDAFVTLRTRVQVGRTLHAILIPYLRHWQDITMHAKICPRLSRTIRENGYGREQGKRWMAKSRLVPGRKPVRHTPGGPASAG